MRPKPKHLAATFGCCCLFYMYQTLHLAMIWYRFHYDIRAMYSRRALALAIHARIHTRLAHTQPYSVYIHYKYISYIDNVYARDFHESKRISVLENAYLCAPFTGVFAALCTQNMEIYIYVTVHIVSICLSIYTYVCMGSEWRSTVPCGLCKN